MANPTLTGTEVLQVQATNSATGLAATTQTTTTGAIAALAALETTSEIATTLSTVGAGTILAAAIIGRNVLRTGTQTGGFTDTTDTAAAIIAALPSGAGVGTSFKVNIVNNSVGGFAETITGGVGVTVSGITVIQPGNFASYLLTYSAAGTVTMVGVAGGQATTGFGNLLVAGLVQESTTVGITAGAAGQSTATALTTEVNQISTCAAGNGVALPAAQTGLTVYVINNGANALTVYGNNTSADTIDGVATGTGVLQMVNSLALYTCTVGGAAGKWISEGLGTGYAGSLQTISYANALSANSGGVQSGATPITTSLSRFTTVGGAGYSSLLPASAPGMSITVINAAAANSMNVFPAGSDQINNLAASAAFSLPIATTATFYCTVAGQWHTLSSGNVSTGTFTANGASAVTVTNANVTINSTIIPTLKTVGGTVGAIPAVKTITPGTGFTIAGTASDTSVYNYIIFG